MQTKGGGKHDILPAAEACSDRALLPVNDAPRTRCGHVPGLFQRAEEHREVRRGRLAEKRRHIRHAARGATAHDSLLIHPIPLYIRQFVHLTSFPPLRREGQ
jgi:hypothetical protein